MWCTETSERTRDPATGEVGVDKKERRIKAKRIKRIEGISRVEKSSLVHPYSLICLPLIPSTTH